MGEEKKPQSSVPPKSQEKPARPDPSKGLIGQTGHRPGGTLERSYKEDRERRGKP